MDEKVSFIYIITFYMIYRYKYGYARGEVLKAPNRGAVVSYVWRG